MTTTGSAECIDCSAGQYGAAETGATACIPSSCITLTAVFDGTLFSKPRGVELFASCDVADLGAYGLGVASNSLGSAGAE